MPQRRSSSSSRRSTRNRPTDRRRTSQHAPRTRTRVDSEYPDYSIVDARELPEGPDVLLDVPVVKVDELEIEVDDLRAQVAVSAEVRELVMLSVGVDASLGKVELRLEGVEAQALLKAKLDNVSLILERVLMSLDRNPELLQSIGAAAEEAGKGAGHLIGESGEAVADVGEGAEQAVGDLGQGAAQGVRGVGQGAQQGVAGLGQGAAQGVRGVGQGAGQGVAGLGQQQQGGQRR